MLQNITKSGWLATQRCRTLGWFELRKAPNVPTEAEKFRMEQGQEVGELARELFPTGILIQRRDKATPVEVTQELTNSPNHDTFFEAAFAVDSFTAKADILRREGRAWHVLEVKSSFATSDRIDELVDDLAYTVFVLRRAGRRVTRASLVLLSHQYKFGQPAARLFEIVDKTADVNKRLRKIGQAGDGILKALLHNRSPTGRLISYCRECAYFTTKCIGFGVSHTVFEVPGLHAQKLERLSEAGIVDLSRIPSDLELSDVQRRARRAVLSGQVAIARDLKKRLQGIEWPCHYLDFETVATVLPLYPGHGCHQQVLTQFSIHHRNRIDAQPTHSEYLADATRDCERELADKLVKALGNKGAIIVYSNFEKTRIEALKESFPDLADKLSSILSRLCDLLNIVEENVYHPDFHGSFSIKKVLPALVPGLSYADLRIRNGDTAITRFAAMGKGQIVGEEATRTRSDLLAYCERDTLAMVRLHEALYKLTAPIN